MPRRNGSAVPSASAGVNPDLGRLVDMFGLLAKPFVTLALAPT
jgi:hypothetical protein